MEGAGGISAAGHNVLVYRNTFGNANPVGHLYVYGSGDRREREYGGADRLHHDRRADADDHDTIAAACRDGNGAVSTQVLSATGGAAPYTFTLAQGSSLPSGLTPAANGSISGTPTAAGTFQVTVTVTDSSQPVQTGTATFAITVRPFSPDLLISSGSLAFTLASGAAALPPSQNVPVEATDPTEILNSSATITPSVNWLTLAGGKTGSATPGAFQVALTAGASQLSASATPYSANVVVSCLSPSPCAGNTQNLAVKLLVSTVSPQLTALTDLVSFNTPAANPQIRRSRLQCRIRAAGRSRLHR